MQIMRVVASLACQRSLTSQVALGLPKPVRCAHDLEVVDASFLRISDVVSVETRKGLIRLVSKRLLAIMPDTIWQGTAGGFQVALLAYLHLTVVAQVSGIENK